MWVQSLGQEDPLEKSMIAHSSVLAWRIPMDRGAWRVTVRGVSKSQTQLKQLTHTHTPSLLAPSPTPPSLALASGDRGPLLSARMEEPR